MKYTKNVGMRWISIIVLSLLSCLLFDMVLAVNATGSVYTLGEFSITSSSTEGNGTIYSSSASSVLSPVTDDAQGLESGAVIGITGSAILTQNKMPIIKSYSITPNPVNQSSWVRMFISAVYTNQVLMNITRPDSTVDTINMGAQSVYYYPYTNLLGRYYVMFIAEGNSIVIEEDDFDVVEVEEPYIPPEEDEEPRRSGGSSGVISSYNALYVSILHMCNDTPRIILEVTNDTSIVSGVLVSIKSSITGNIDLNFTTDMTGRVEFEIPPGDYMITASASNHIKYSGNYELHCGVMDFANSTDNMSNDNESTITSISGQAVLDNLNSGEIQQGSQDELTTAELASASRILERQSTTMFTASFLAYLTFASLIFVFALIVLLKLYRRDAECVLMEKEKIEPRIIILENKTLLEKKLMPIEQEIIRIEGELHGLNKDNKSSGTKSSDTKLDSVPIEVNIVDVKDVMPTIKQSPLINNKIESKVVDTKDIQKTLDMDYVSVIGLPYKKSIGTNEANDKTLSSQASSTQRSSPKKTSVTVRAKDIKKLYSYLSDVPEGHAFVLCNGNKINNLDELLRSLKYVDDDIFKYHVTDGKNDFATWVYDTVGYRELAEAMGPIKSRDRIIEIVKSRIDDLKQQ